MTSNQLDKMSIMPHLDPVALTDEMMEDYVKSSELILNAFVPTARPDKKTLDDKVLNGDITHFYVKYINGLFYCKLASDGARRAWYVSHDDIKDDTTIETIRHNYKPVLGDYEYTPRSDI